MKFKHAQPGYFIKIDDAGNQSPSFNDGKPGTSGAYLFAEMQKWIADGREVLPQFDAEELAAEEAEEAKQALVNQHSNCARLLFETDHKVSNHTKFPGDVPEWEIYRAKLWVIQDSGKIETIPDKPFPK